MGLKFKYCCKVWSQNVVKWGKFLTQGHFLLDTWQVELCPQLKPYYLICVICFYRYLFIYLFIYSGLPQK